VSIDAGEHTRPTLRNAGKNWTRPLHNPEVAKIAVLLAIATGVYEILIDPPGLVDGRLPTRYFHMIDIPELKDYLRARGVTLRQ
jgi:hypothetical protein